MYQTSDLSLLVHGHETMLLAADAQRFDVFSINRVQSLIQRCYTPLKRAGDNESASKFG